jgi:CubicO group peptidase (beta-lactamase class C family)
VRALNALNRLLIPSRRTFLQSCATGLGLLSERAAHAQTPLQMQATTGEPVPAMRAHDELMKSFVADHQVPGAALAVTVNRRLAYARGFGHANVEKQQPVRPNSLFGIGSISKTFTAAAILRLA